MIECLVACFCVCLSCLQGIKTAFLEVSDYTDEAMNQKTDSFTLLLGNKRGLMTYEEAQTPSISFSEHPRDAYRMMTLVSYMLYRHKKTDWIGKKLLSETEAYSKTADYARKDLCAQDLEILVEEGICQQTENGHLYRIKETHLWQIGHQHSYREWLDKGAPFL